MSTFREKLASPGQSGNYYEELIALAPGIFLSSNGSAALSGQRKADDCPARLCPLQPGLIIYF